MQSFNQDMKIKAKMVAVFMQGSYPRIIKVEALKHFKKSFKNEGFIDETLQKWKKRSTTDKYGRNNTRYKTNRVGRAGAPNKKGRNITGRPTLTGFNSAGNKLRNSLQARIDNGQVVIYTYKEYAERHNEGLDGMPQRQFIGESGVLDRAIEKKVDRELKKIFG